MSGVKLVDNTVISLLPGTKRAVDLAPLRTPRSHQNGRRALCAVGCSEVQRCLIEFSGTSRSWRAAKSSAVSEAVGDACNSAWKNVSVLARERRSKSKYCLDIVGGCWWIGFDWTTLHPGWMDLLCDANPQDCLTWLYTWKSSKILPNRSKERRAKHVSTWLKCSNRDLLPSKKMEE